MGIGGGVVIVPALILTYEYFGLFDQRDATVVAVATSLACIVFTSLSAAIAQIRADMVDWTIVKRWTAFLLLGSLTAGLLAPMLPGPLFRGIIGVFLAFVAVVMLTNWKPAPHRQMPGRLGAAAFGYAGGVISGVAGIGGGNVIVPTLTFLNTPVHRATATSSTLGRTDRNGWGTGVPHLRIRRRSDTSAAFRLRPLASDGRHCRLTAVLLAPVGVRTAHRVPAAQLKRAFGVLLVFVSARMLYDALS